MKNRILLLLPWALLATAPPVFAFEVRAHRGGRTDWPQNTLQAFEAAIEYGADSIELNVHLTSDHVLVVSHDPEVHQIPCTREDGNPITKPRPIIELTLNEIKQYDCGKLGDPEFPKQNKAPGAKIPTLNEVLDLLERSEPAHSRKVRLAVEIKLWPEHPSFTPPRNVIAKALMELLKKRKMTERTSVISLDSAVLAEIKQLAPSQSIQLKTTDPKLVAELAKPKRKPELAIDTVLPPWEHLNPSHVKALHKKGLKVIPGTVNDSSTWKKLMDLGVDGITTDDPNGLLEFIESQNELEAGN